MLVIISIIIAVVAGFGSLRWFFRDGQDADRSMERAFNGNGGFLDAFGAFHGGWLFSKFGLWVAFSGGVGYGSYSLLPVLWRYLQPFVERALG